MTAAPPRRTRRVLPALLLIAAVALLGWSDLRYLITAPEARTAAAALRGTTVYVAPGEQEVLDAARVEQVIGDRPIVVAVLADTYDGDQLDACKVVARLQPRTIVLAYLGSERGAYPAICATDRFPEPQNVKDSILEDVSRTDTWLSGIARTAQQASQFRVNDQQADRTPEIEELVLAFDARAVVDYPDGVPTRKAGADPRTWTAVLAQLTALVVVLAAAFAGLRWLAHRLREWCRPGTRCATASWNWMRGSRRSQTGWFTRVRSCGATIRRRRYATPRQPSATCWRSPPSRRRADRTSSMSPRRRCDGSTRHFPGRGHDRVADRGRAAGSRGGRACCQRLATGRFGRSAGAGPVGACPARSRTRDGPGPERVRS